MKQKPQNICPCHSNLLFTQCCQPLLLGATVAATPEQLMRSRYSAYSRKKIKYLLQTWHESTRPKLEKFETGSWIHLEILHASKVENLNSAIEAGTVEFIAKHISKNSSKYVLTELHELSTFERTDGLWSYISGVIKKNSQFKIEPKASCPCKSGKIFKDCHFKL